MSGISGIIARGDLQAAAASIQAMTAALRHEDFYTSGTLVEEKVKTAAGWAVQSGSFADVLPIWNENRDVCLLFCGENFADGPELDQLAARGHQFDRKNASYLVHLYEEHGDRFFERLNGIFSGLLIDLRQSRVILFNDRYGLGRVYYHEGPEGFYFSSEAKSILKVRPELRELCQRGFGEFFACGSVLQNRTFFKGIFLLPPGSAWSFDRNGVVSRQTYFDHSAWENQSQLSVEDYYAQLRETFARIVPRYLQEPERIAMSLTGGLDSRMVMAWTGLPGNTLQCYSHRGPFHECADARVGRKVAVACGQKHRVIRVNGEFCSKFPTLARKVVQLTDGNMDVSGAAGLYANQVAKKEIASIRMTGNYGGEVLRGIVALGPAKLLNPYFSNDFSPIVREGVATLAAERKSVGQMSFIAFKQVPWHHYSRFAMENSQITVRSPYLDNELVKLAYRAPQSKLTNQKIAVRLIADGNPALAAFPTDRGPLGRDGFFGRISERWQEITFKADYAFDYGMPQWYMPIDRALTPLHLERLFLGRHKYYHFRYWYGTVLAPFVRDTLLNSRALGRPYLNGKRVEQLVTAHITGSGNYTSEIHTLLTTELLHQEFID